MVINMVVLQCFKFLDMSYLLFQSGIFLYIKKDNEVLPIPFYYLQVFGYDIFGCYYTLFNFFYDFCILLCYKIQPLSFSRTFFLSGNQ